jgi:hypothetical protein
MNNLQSTYAERIEAARRRLPIALHPQDRQEHAAVDHLFRCIGDLAVIETIAALTERAIRTARRAGRMSVAALTLEFFTPAAGSPVDILARMEHIASGGDDGGGDDLAQLVADAYERGWREAGGRP